MTVTRRDHLNPISKAEINDLINHLPYGGDRWLTCIDSVVRVLDAAEAKDVAALRRLASNAKGGKLPKLLAGLAISFVEHDDVRSAMDGPKQALRRFFHFSRPCDCEFSFWLAGIQRRINEASQPVESRPDTRSLETRLEQAADYADELLRSSTKKPAGKVTREEKLDTIALIGKKQGPRLELHMLVAQKDLISPELARAMLKLAYDSIGVTPGAPGSRKAAARR